jgi:hypothetical protein
MKGSKWPFMEIEANFYICRNIMEMFNEMFLELTGDKSQKKNEKEKRAYGRQGARPR